MQNVHTLRIASGLNVPETSLLLVAACAALAGEAGAAVAGEGSVASPAFGTDTALASESAVGMVGREGRRLTTRKHGSEVEESSPSPDPDEPPAPPPPAPLCPLAPAVTALP